ncbi:uncharacterized protein F4807DRAFT_119777 [Annulohypoxylon truncatum]|uniref:uncharacterized protein n=1 Tax=Annulohypoxylon truncatum TaxID=327061 RepID=UPI002008BCDA|nr:uncharacterized protein F4807DRAFT_119777 [Annulohypoxylon truncatum]KAI1214275.1 hypothetical protein F4807DRAFT_119777 [Annulohypoxylon truncatum]
MMRTVSNRVLALAFRYGSVLLAALLVYYVIREPLNSAVSNVSFLGKGTLQAAEQGSGRDGIAAVGGAKAVDDDAQLAPAGTAEDVPEKKAQEPMGDVDIVYEKKYKPDPAPSKPIGDHFPWLTYSNTPPPVLDNNLPPFPHVEEATPLLIGFTRNWPLLLQCVSSYIAAGWPAEDIYVVENTGTFHSNRDGDLELQNPFFLNHTALGILGVKVLETPTLLSFSQMQNYFLSLALEHDWPHFWWSHMDVVVFSDEDVKKNDRDHDWDHDPYATIYERSVGLLRYLNGPDMPPWATHFFQFDHLALVNRDAYLEVGAWDTQIPYYASDCDMYLRLHWAGYWQPQSEAGLVFDVASAFDDIAALFRVAGSHATFEGDPVYAKSTPGSSEDERAHHEADLKREQDMYPWVEKEGETFAHLVEVAGRMQDLKWKDEGTRRNEWQTRQTGGRDDPFYRDPEGFAAGVETLVDAGRRVFADKWGHRGCDLLAMGIEGKDAWRLQRDWDINEGPGSEGGNWGKDWMTGSDGE